MAQNELGNIGFLFTPLNGVVSPYLKKNWLPLMFLGPTLKDNSWVFSLKAPCLNHRCFHSENCLENPSRELPAYQKNHGWHDPGVCSIQTPTVGTLWWHLFWLEVPSKIEIIGALGAWMAWICGECDVNVSIHGAFRCDGYHLWCQWPPGCHYNF